MVEAPKPLKMQRTTLTTPATCRISPRQSNAQNQISNTDEKNRKQWLDNSYQHSYIDNESNLDDVKSSNQ